MTRPILSLKKSKRIVTNPPATEAPKSAPDKTQQEAPQQPQKKNKADAHAKKRKRRTDRIAQHWTIFTEQGARPLAIGIREQMIADAEARELDITVSHIKQGLYDYINRKVYLKALTLGGSRFDMTGQPNGEVTPEQQQDAQRKLEKWEREADHAKKHKETD
ncbi:ProQ/FINO family protein [Morganella psychrotolerans]|uniref:Osmoprotectant transporter ProQ n=1 Tax=Morganella psychrotolerans TaxID=368603 RepID=A0A1B8HMX7_9GAMM|nr:ProQ/FINO family protein [Morganella psychrotolerans]OBU10768.1 osmoprotectant transporter ProQ [Morganella psychrotolerans]